METCEKTFEMISVIREMDEAVYTNRKRETRGDKREERGRVYVTKGWKRGFPPR